MKKGGLFCVLGLFALIAISSCLGEDGQKITVDNQPGVVIKTNDSTKVYLKDRVIYDDKFGSAYNHYDCILVKYNIDYGLFANADTGRRFGLFKAEILKHQEVPKLAFFSQLTDTATLLFDREERLLPSIDKQYSIIQDQLFLYTNHTVVDSIVPNDYMELSYDTELEPVWDEINNKDVYDLFIRVAKGVETTTNKTTESQLKFISSFNIEDLLAKNSSGDTIFFRINYGKSFNKDTTKIVSWGNQLFQYPVNYQSQKQ